MTNPVEEKETSGTASSGSSNEEPNIRSQDAFTERDLEKLLKEQDNFIRRLLRAGQQIATVYIDQRSGGVFFNGNTQVGGDVIGGSQSKHGYYAETKVGYKGFVNELLVNTLNKISSVYVCPPNYAAAKEILETRHVLIIHGPARRGKYATALYLLLGIHNNAVGELDPLSDLTILDFSDKGKQGYVINNISNEKLERTSVFHLDRLSRQLQDCGAHLIITVDDQIAIPQGLEKYRLYWNELPDRTELLERHLKWYAPDPDVYQRAVALSDFEDVKSVFSQASLPGEIDQLASLLVDTAIGKLSLSEALNRFKGRLYQHVAAWFDNHPSIDDRALLLSVAVYNGASRQIISNAERQLLSLLSKVGESSPSTNLFGSSYSQRVNRVEATIKSGVEETKFGQNPVEVVEFNNPVMQPVVLRYVWNEFDHLREIIVRWLRESVIGTPPDMQVRAAVAVGELARYDFNYLYQETLHPWSMHSDPTIRGLAALALGIPAWDSDKSSLVLSLLRHWSNINDWRLCWTAAAACGGLVGRRFLDPALQNLRDIAQKGELRLLAILSQSMTNLFDVGEAIPEYRLKIVDTLLTWTAKPTTILGVTGLFVFLYIAETSRITALPEGDKWPFLLWIICEDDILAKNICELWRRSLNLRATRPIALSVIRNWLKVVDEDTRLYKGIAWLLTTIVHQGSERESERIKHLLRSLHERSLSSTATRILNTL
ncbi:hypothetical protein [Chloroflexus aurantiacus]